MKDNRIILFSRIYDKQGIVFIYPFIVDTQVKNYTYVYYSLFSMPIAQIYIQFLCDIYIHTKGSLKNK